VSVVHAAQRGENSKVRLSSALVVLSGTILFSFSVYLAELPGDVLRRRSLWISSERRRRSSLPRTLFYVHEMLRLSFAFEMRVSGNLYEEKKWCKVKVWFT